MDINNSQQLRKILLLQVIYPLIKEISQELVSMVRNEMLNARISTKTMREYTTYELSKTNTGYVSTILVRDDLMQTEEEVGTYGVFNRFMSLNMENEYGGHNISWHLVSWLEDKGANGKLGNNPIQSIGMFEKTFSNIEKELPRIISNFSKKYGVVII